MFHTFSGNSRRPRQVNLSGHNPNPFASNTWGSASTTKQTVASAQQERQQRQQEREKLNASKQIQRVWRGHKVRKDVADGQRKLWDEAEASKWRSDPDVLREQLRFLVLFYNSRQQQDIQRLGNLSQRISEVGCVNFLAAQQIQTKLTKLANFALEALQRYAIVLLMLHLHMLINYSSLPDCPVALLELLVGIVNQQPQNFPTISQQYYTYLSSLLSTHTSGKLDRNSIISALRIPLVQNLDSPDSCQYALSHVKYTLTF